MNIVFKNKKGDVVYTVTDINFGEYKRQQVAFVGGGYGEGTIPRRMPTKLFRCKKTNRPCLKLFGGKMYAVNIEDDAFFDTAILDKAPLK